MTSIRTYSALVVLAIVSVLGLVACGGSDSSSSSPTTGSTAGETVSLADVSGVGNVLVDSQGNALYSRDLEAGGKVLCMDGCTSIWEPLTVSSGSEPTGPSDVSSKLGVVDRPDGTKQVTFEGKPLYTFVEDQAPDMVTGNGVSDSFDGTGFTWHVASLGATSSGSTSTQGGYGY